MTISRPEPLPLKFSSIPDELRSINRWVMWRYVPITKEDGTTKWNKMPCRPSGEAAKSTDASTWCSYDDAVDAWMSGEFDGIGITFNGSDDIHGIDLDDCVQDGKLNKVAKDLLAKVQGYAELSPSGTGIKLFTRSNLAISGKRGDVEVYRDGRYFTVTGHVLKTHKALPDVKQDVEWFVKEHFGSNQSAGNEGGLATYKAPLPEWDVERVRDELISHIGDIETYQDWLNVGMMLHHQGQGDEHWMELWDELSRQTASYNRSELESKWNSFSEQRSRGAGALTIASLIKRANDARAVVSKERFEEYKQQLEEAATYNELVQVLCPKIKMDMELDRINRNVLANLLKTKFKVLGNPLAVTEIRQMIRPKLTGEVPTWLDGWVYVTHEDRLFNVVTKRKVTIAGFNAMYNREVGAMETDSTASVMALDLFRIPTPDKIIYLPYAPEIFDMNGTPCVNGYDHNSPPDIPAAYSKSDRVAIETIKAHLMMILVSPDAVGLMVNWMAHNVQFPGRKIRWAPLIKGIEGDGKSVIGKLMGMVMGQGNVGFVSPKTLADGKYTGWADGKCVNVLEEIRMVGHNRHDMLNTVKPYITNDVITVHPKHVNEYVAPNTVNYIAFTNHQDALPLDDTDRRWWVQFTPFTCQEELVGVANADYFDKLNGAIEEHYPALRKWLLEWDIPETFRPNGQAPQSVAKTKMIALNVSEEELSIRELIEQGAPGVHRDAVSTHHLNMAISMSESTEPLRTTSLSRVMMKLGFSRINKQIKWNGQPVRVWIRGIHLNSLDEAALNDEVRKMLDETLPVDPLS